MNILALDLTYRLTMEVKRAVKTAGIIGDPSTHLTDVKCSYVMPVDPSGITGLRESEIIQTLTEVFWVYVKETPDIVEGDWVVVDGVTYSVKMSQQMSIPSVLSSQEYTRLTVERLSI